MNYFSLWVVEVSDKSLSVKILQLYFATIP